jgi:Transposase DDE domain group 1
LSQDPTFRLIGSSKIWARGEALTSRLQSFETEVLTQEDNLAGLAALNRELIARAESIDSPWRVVPDMDSTEIPVYGEQERSAYNGHFECTCYHPCCCSTAKATAWRRNCARATSTAPRAGRNCYCRRTSANTQDAFAQGLGPYTEIPV